jgi:hypothetical protein
MTSKPRFRPINTLDVSDEDIASISDRMNVPKLVRMEAEPVTATRRETVASSRQEKKADAATKGQGDARQRKTTFRIPEQLNDAMKYDAIEARTNVRLIVLGALRRAGYRVDNRSLPSNFPTVRQRAVEPSFRKLNGAVTAGQTSPSPQQKLSIDFPDNVSTELKRKSITQETSIRALVLLALRGYGYPVADADLARGAGGNC